jgi:hypothetical protein
MAAASAGCVSMPPQLGNTTIAVSMGGVIRNQIKR